MGLLKQRYLALNRSQPANLCDGSLMDDRIKTSKIFTAMGKPFSGVNY